MRCTIRQLIGLTVAGIMLPGNLGLARPNFFDANCAVCHTDDTRTCNGCHHHGNPPRVAVTDLDEYEPGSPITVIVGGPVNSGWSRAILYDQNGVEIDRVTGPTGMGDDGTGSSDLEYPFVMTGTAPFIPGTYRWETAWWGSPYDKGNTTAFPHGEGDRVQTNEFTVVGNGPIPVDAAVIDVLAVSPRVRDIAPDDIFDVKSTGLEVVGVNKQVYLVSVPKTDYASSITGYTWSVLSEPSPGAAVIDLDTPDFFKFHGTVEGSYTIQLVPTVTGATGLPVTQRIYAARYVGTGTEGSNTPAPPNCGFSSCHGDGQADSRLNKVSDWQGTKHAHMLENFLNGAKSATYRTSCLECHTLGYDETTQGNDNFHEIAQDIAFDLNQIPTWVADAYTSGNPHWDDLPAPLQLKSNIQCEHCHGPGSGHNGDRSKITGPQYDALACRQCHDAPPHHPIVAQYDSSKHAQTNLAGDGHVAGSSTCQRCHVAEGFIFIRVRGEDSIPGDVASRNALNCVGCHDPHSTDNPHQLRAVGPVTLPNGTVFDGGYGNTCANCHNTRVSNPADQIASSFRGAHHGPQAEVLLGQGAYDWGQPYPAGAGIHSFVVTDTCVTCHMAEPVSDEVVELVGGHTWALNSGEVSNAESACGGCHSGLTTTDRVPFVPVDYDGDGFTSGIQTEVGGLLEIVRNAILTNIPGTSYDAEERRISISSSDYGHLPFDIKAVLYNFNVCSEDKSLGVHNNKYVVAVLQRTYRFATGDRFAEEYPLATIVDDYTAVRPKMWRLYR